MPSAREPVDRLALLAGVLAFLAFAPSLAAGFVYDDLPLITEDPYAQRLEFVFRGFRTHLWDVYSWGERESVLRYYRPLVTSSYVLNWILGGGTAWTFHLVNVVCHALSVVLAVRVAARWIGDPRLGLAAGLLFAVHPTRTESVIWVSGRTDVFMALFMLSAVELAWRASRSRGARLFGLGALSLASFVLATLGKEAAVLTFALVLADALTLPSDAPQRRRLFGLALVLASLGLGYAVARAAFYPVSSRSGVELTPRYGLFTVWAYLERIAWPWPQTFFHRPAEARDSAPVFPWYLLALGAAVSALFFAILVRAWRRDRVAFVLFATGAAGIGPLLNFWYTGVYVTTSDHFLYLPLLLVVAGALRLCRERLSPLMDARAFKLAAVGLLSIYVVIDVVRVFDYRGARAFWEHERSLNPDNPVVLSELGVLWARSGELERARDLMGRATSAASGRFFLLAGPKTTRAVRRGRLLALEAALLPDGEVRKLERIYGALDGLLRRRRSPDGDRPLAEAELVAALGHDAELAALAADTALVGTRIGATERARALARGIPDEMLWRAPSPLNLVLTHARLGDFARARRLLQIAHQPPPGVAPAGNAESLREVAGQLARAAALFEKAARTSGVASRVARAMAQAELGAYLEALRTLRPAFDAAPSAPEVGPLYVQLLVSARLRGEALAVASSLLGSESGARVVATIEGQLGPRLRQTPAPSEPSAWWPQ